VTRRGGLAQLAERLLCMQKVRGSIPLTSNSSFGLSFSRNDNHFYFSHTGGRHLFNFGAVSFTYKV
jgi:hypothetical protein